MTAVPADLDAYLTTHDERIRHELFEFLRIPSVSARSEHDADTRRAAEWTADALRAAGLQTTVHPTAGYPVDALRFVKELAAAWDGADPPRSAVWRER